MVLAKPELPSDEDITNAINEDIWVETDDINPEDEPKEYIQMDIFDLLRQTEEEGWDGDD